MDLTFDYGLVAGRAANAGSTPLDRIASASKARLVCQQGTFFRRLVTSFGML
jgi:hypothetical protein